MGSFDQNSQSHLRDTKTIDQSTPNSSISKTRFSHDCIKENKFNTKKKAKEPVANDAQGNGSGIVIRIETVGNLEDESDIRSENKISGTENNSTPGKEINSYSNESEKGCSGNGNKSQIGVNDDDLKGKFFVNDVQNYGEFVDSDSGNDLFAMEKSLTLAVSPLVPLPRPIQSSSMSADEIIDGEWRNDETQGEINKDRNVDLEEIDSKSIAEKENLKTSDESESAKPANDIMDLKEDNGKCENKEISVFDQIQTKSRTGNKHNNRRRSQVQEVMPEIDETSCEDIGSSIDHDIDRKKNENSVEPKMLWKHHNNGAGSSECSIKEDLLVDSSSQSRTPTVNRTGASIRSSSGLSQVNRLHNMGSTNGESVKVNDSRQVNSFISNIPNVSCHDYPRSSRLSFDCTSSKGLKNDDGKPKGFQSIFERRYTKLELRKALPRKSTFSCHEKAMKDAGLQVEDPQSKRRAERLKAKLERIAKEYEPLPPTVISQCEKDKSGVTAPGEDTTSATDEYEQSQVSDPNLNEENANDINETNDDNTGDKVDARLRPDAAIRMITKRKRLHNEKSDHVECKPLTHYLEHIKENQLEYENYHNGQSTNANNKPVTRLINMGRAFELRHCGGSPKRTKGDVLVMAAKALRPRSSDPSKYYKHDDSKSSPYGRIQDPILRQTRPSSDDKRRQEKNSSNTNITKDDDHTKTEFERKKNKAEEWAMSVSTNTLTRAKIQSLRELGTDDEELTKWWIALRKCHYLRVKSPTE